MDMVYIIILVWNNCQDTLECMSSIERVDYLEHQVILVDNGSTDNTVISVRQLFPWVHIIENGRNLGYAEGNNVGIRYALSKKADYILILNNDTIVDPGILSAFVSTARENPEFGILSGRIYWYSQPTLPWFDGAQWKNDIASFVPDRSGGEASDTLTDRLTDYACGCAMFLRSDMLSKIGLFDPRFFLTWEEADLCYRARRAGYSIKVEPKALVWHKVSSSFNQGGAGAHYQYYYTRNRLLWIEKNLVGMTKISAFKRCVQEIYWRGLETRRRGAKIYEDLVFRARLLGLLHYTVRRFGSGPAFD